MPAEWWGLVVDAAAITAFVAVMMMAVEYLNVSTRGAFERALRAAPIVQYVTAVALGAIPGCLGAFTVVALYTHRVVTLGAVVGTMIASTGDEAFVMLALFPRTAVALMLGLAVLGLAVAPVVDRLAGRSRLAPASCRRLAVHAEDHRSFALRHLRHTWAPPSSMRVLLLLALAGLAAWIVLGRSAVTEAAPWLRAMLLLVVGLGAGIVATAPEHFLRRHLWRHVVVRHVPRIFPWTAGALLAIALLQHFTDLGALVRGNSWMLLLGAGLLGLIPESGPHLVFAALYATGQLPIGILVASSIVQDGHGMLPLLAQSRRDFLRVKAVNLVVGVGVGATLLERGW